MFPISEGFHGDCGENTQTLPIFDSITGESIVGYGVVVDKTTINVYPDLSSDGVIVGVDVVVISNGGSSSIMKRYGLELDGLTVDNVQPCVAQMGSLIIEGYDVQEAMIGAFSGEVANDDYLN